MNPDNLADGNDLNNRLVPLLLEYDVGVSMSIITRILILTTLECNKTKEELLQVVGDAYDFYKRCE
jgi:hypothetical protein